MFNLNNEKMIKLIKQIAIVIVGIAIGSKVSDGVINLLNNLLIDEKENGD